jgi:SGNH hydrolase-like domain, acetyltransferase AlgX
MVRTKRLSVILSQMVLIFLITLVLAEISLRMYNQINPSFIFYSNSYNRYRGKPFAPDYDFHLNSKGYKDVEFNPQKAEGIFRILGIGDSFTYGVVPYQYNYLTLLEESLNKSRRKVEVMNMGIPSIGPRDYLSLFVHEGLALRPDMIIISFFVGNDFERQKRKKLSTYSYVVSFTKYLIDLHKKFEGQITHGDARYDDTSRTFTDEAYLQLEQSRSYIFLRQNKNFARAFSDSIAHLIRIRDICLSQKIRLLIVVIPDELQVNNLLRQAVISGSGLDRDEFDFTLPNRLLAQTFEQEKIDYIDLFSNFASASARENLYKPNDSHWNIAGNKLAARVIQEHLLARTSIAERGLGDDSKNPPRNIE